MSRKVDIAWMVRTGRACEGRFLTGTLSWSCGGEPAGSISYRADMRNADDARLVLSYTKGEGEDRETIEQIVLLTYTQPHFGGKRWWMICPYRGHRVGKLYMPQGGDRFASRKAWRLGYNSQRIAGRDRPFEAMFRLQRRLGCEAGWGQWITRPKGMHRKTFERYLDEYEALDRSCAISMARLMFALSGK